jgi:diguanylate cyclase (GGDEF)-like protein
VTLTRRWTTVLLVAVTLCAGGIVTALVGYALDHADDRYLRQAMERYTGDVADGVAMQMGQYADTLRDISRAVAAQQELTVEDFEDITAGLEPDRFPGVSGLGLIVPATPEQYDAVQRYWRGLGAKDLVLTQGTPGRGQHAFIVQSRTLDGGSPVRLGTDATQVPQLYAAMVQSRMTRLVTATQTYVLLKDRGLPQAQQKQSFSLVAPVRKRDGHFMAWLVMGIHGTDFLDRTLSQHAQGMVQVRVQENQNGGTVTIASALGGSAVEDSGLTQERTVTVGQRKWRLTMVPTTNLLNSTDRRLRLVAIGSCVGVTLLLALLVGALAGARNRAMVRVEHATAALREDIARREQVEKVLRERESELQHLAFHDPLTGLANRILFYERVSHALLTHARAATTFAVIFIDLDGFKAVNDRLGHAAGDELLRSVADRLQSCLRASDTIARFGGDEFAVITEGLTRREDVHKAATRIVESLGAPYELEAGSGEVSASVGIALSRPGDSADDILREADLAMYTAKKAGKARYVLAGRP